jgi:hypothetical protein
MNASLKADGLTEPHPSAAEIASYVIAAAVWAPSVHNTQPWWFSPARQTMRLHADAGRQLMTADPSGREMLISCGAALFTVRLALRSLGYIPQTRVLPDPAQPLLVAEVSWQRRAAVTDYEQRLFEQVRRRRTHRGGFDPLPLSANLLAALRKGADRDGAALHIVTDEGRKAALGSLVETAERSLRLNPRYVRELARWVTPPGVVRPDGIPPTAYPARPERTEPDFPSRDFSHGRGWGQAPVSWAHGHVAGVVTLLTTAADERSDWVNAGQALQRLLLFSTSFGVAAAIHSQPLEIGWLRHALRAQLADGSYPQLMLRLGTAIQTGRSPRRAPEDVIHPGGWHG